MPSFDIVSEYDEHELQNALDQTRRELATRFDLKGSGARLEYTPPLIVLRCDTAFQIRQINDILENKLARRGIDVRCLHHEELRESNNEATQNITLRQGIDREHARSIVKRIKDEKLKVQAAIQGNRIRVSGKKRDQLQAVMALIREEKFPLPLQFVNLRD